MADQDKMNMNGQGGDAGPDPATDRDGGGMDVGISEDARERDAEQKEPAAGQSPDAGAGPPSEESAKGAQGMAPGRAAFACLLIVIIGVAGYRVIREVRQMYFAPKPPQGDVSRDFGEGEVRYVEPPQPVGKADAPIHLQVCMGHCIAPVMSAIRDAVKGWPDLIRAEFYAYESGEGQDLLAKHNETIACIFINGSNRFEITGSDGKAREIVFRGPPGQNYTLKDVALVLRQVIQRKGLEVPEDFDARMGDISFSASSCGSCGGGGGECPSGGGR